MTPSGECHAIRNRSFGNCGKCQACKDDFFFQQICDEVETKGLELAKLARRDRQEFDCATWLHKAWKILRLHRFLRHKFVYDRLVHSPELWKGSAAFF